MCDFDEYKLKINNFRFSDRQGMLSTLLDENERSLVAGVTSMAPKLLLLTVQGMNLQYPLIILYHVFKVVK